MPPTNHNACVLIPTLGLAKVPDSNTDQNGDDGDRIMNIGKMVAIIGAIGALLAAIVPLIIFLLEPDCPDSTGVYLIKDVKKGDIITGNMVEAKNIKRRWPSTINDVVGGFMVRDLAECTELTSKDIGVK